MKIEDAIENLEITIMIEETKHSMRDADGELEHGETKRHMEQVESLKMGIAALEKQKEVVHCNDCKLKDECEKKINGHYYPPDSYTAVNWSIEGITYCSGGSRV